MRFSNLARAHLLTLLRKGYRKGQRRWWSGSIPWHNTERRRCNYFRSLPIEEKTRTFDDDNVHEEYVRRVKRKKYILCRQTVTDKEKINTLIFNSFTVTDDKNVHGGRGVIRRMYNTYRTTTTIVPANSRHTPLAI